MKLLLLSFSLLCSVSLAFVPLQNSAAAAKTKVEAVTVRNDRVSAPSTTHKKKAKTVVIDSAKLRRSKWGVDNEHEDEYWFNDQVRLLA